MKAQVALYKGPGNIVDKAIRWWTKSKYSHAELVINELWYSTSPRDLKVRSKAIGIKEGHWDLINVDIDILSVEALFASTKDAKYDWLGIVLSQFMALNIHSRKRWFCSEWVSEALKIKDSNKYSPQDLYIYLTEGKIK